MLLASFLIVILGISVATGDKASHHIDGDLDRRRRRAARHLRRLAVRLPPLRRDAATAGARRSRAISLGARARAARASAGVGAAFVSDWFIDALTPAMDQIGVPKAFAGLVIVAIAGNAVENTTGVVLALKGEADLAISVVKNSVAQIAAFLFPALVLVSLLFATPLTFALAPVYIGALLLTALALWQITGDGEATMFEGVALIALYVILAVLTFYE